MNRNTNDFSISLISDKFNNLKNQFSVRISNFGVNEEDTPEASRMTNIFKNSKENTSLARQLILISCICFIISGVLKKEYHKYFKVGIIPYSMFLSLFTLGFAYLMVKYNRDPSQTNVDIKILVNDTGAHKYWHFARIISYTMSLNLAIYSFNNTKLVIAQILIQISPIITNILASFVLKETFHIKYIVACFFCVFGIILMISGKHDNNYNENQTNKISGILIGIINSVFLSILNITSKLQSYDFDPYTIAFIVSFWSTIFNFIGCIIFYKLIELTNIFDIKLILYFSFDSIITFIGYVLVQLGFERANLSKLTFLFYTIIPVSAIIGILFFNEFMNPYEVIGGGIIFATTILTSML